MLLLLTIAGAAALAVIAYTRLRNRSPEAASTATRAVRELAAVVLICSRAVEGVLEAVTPAGQPRTAQAGGDVYGGYRRPLADSWDDE